MHVCACVGIWCHVAYHVLQELAVGPRASAPPLVEFDIAQTGLSVWDPQTSTTSRRDFPVKNITYVVKIRNYFAFVAREKGKYSCHAFMESQVRLVSVQAPTT